MSSTSMDTEHGERTGRPDHPRDERRGREAATPWKIPRKGWKDIGLRVKEQVSRDHLTVVAAGVAFYGVLSIVPALAAIVSVYGLVADPAAIEEQVAALGDIMPAAVLGFLEEQMTAIAAGSSASLSVGAIAGILFSIWSANKGMKALVEAMNIAYDEQDERGFVKTNAVSLALTFGAIVTAILALSLVIVLPVVLGWIGLSSWAEGLVSIARWPILFGVMLVGLTVIYRFGPDRDRPRWRWVSPGALAATVLWVIASIGFSLYVSNFGSYNETYGSIGAAVILLMWFFVTAFVVLLGAELNAEIEHQTRQDTTVGEPEPMGERGAYVADELGPAQA